jgi:hypothetical protein
MTNDVGQVMTMPIGQLELNLSGMFIGWSSLKE